MSSLRLAFVTRRFWPLAGGEETVMSNLAVECQRQGASVRILTAQWQTTWPLDAVHREVPITRLRKPPQIGWGMLRYMMTLSRWLRQHEREIDLVYVSHLQHEAHAAVGALLHSRVPVVLRAVGTGPEGDCRWQDRVRFGSRIRRRCQRADAFIASNREALTELAAANYAVNHCFQIHPGVEPFAPRDPQQRLAARRAVATANTDLVTSDDSPVVICLGKLVRAKGIFDLLLAWRSIVDVWPLAKLWFIGDGPDRDKLYDAVLDYDLRSNVMMPGTFDDIEDLLQAADLCILPAHEEAASSMALLEAMAAGVPLIASDIPGHRAIFRSGAHTTLVPPRSPASLTNAVLEIFDSPTLATVRATAARYFVREHHSIEKTAADHLELFERIIAEKKSK